MRILTLRELNRATLARQLLLRRHRLSVPRALERVAGLQAQWPPSPYVGLWSRLEDFTADRLVRAIARPTVVKATLMRTTLHLVSADDYLAYAGTFRERRIAELERHLAALGEEADLSKEGERLRRLAAERPGSRPELPARLGRPKLRLEDRSPWLVWFALAAHAGLVNAPSSSVWRTHTAGGTFVPARTWLGADASSGPEAVEHLVRRYLAAFGPASRPDLAQWSGLPLSVLDTGLERVRLRTFGDELGRTLYDLPRGPLPPADRPAPPRLLPRWDNVLLAHDVRTRVLPDECRGGGRSHRSVRARARPRPMSWLRPDELRVGLGCMRLADDEDLALATIAAAADVGVTVFDTARAYEGNEALLSRALRGAEGTRIVTKGGMERTAGAWIPDGRAKSIRADCEASLAALDGLPIDLFLLHAPDSRVPWRTSLRALGRLVDDGLAAHVGVCNVNRTQLDEALEHAPITAVQVALSRFDDAALRGGVVQRCADAGGTLIAHSPLGGIRRAGRLARDTALSEIAAAHDATPAEVALAWLLGLGPIVAIPGARRPETARSLARAARLELGKEERERLGGAARPKVRARGTGEVVLVMGVPGAGKSRIAADYVERGYLRLNRDEQGGTLRQLADALDEALADGVGNVVLDNTYLSRASRHDVVAAAWRHGASARCVWVETPLAQAQANLVERILGRLGHLPSPDELKDAARAHPDLLTPTRQMRAFRELEPPADDEGFASIEHLTFTRAERAGRPGVFVAAAAAAAATSGRLAEDAPRLLFDWRPDGDTDDLEAFASSLRPTAEWAACTHPGGPPTCWCRPPLPGLVLDFARRRGVDPARSVLVGASPAHRALANALGAQYVDGSG